jgi:hypothetical protein
MGAFLAVQGRNVAAQTSDGDIAPRHVEIKLVSAGNAAGGLEGSLRELLTRLQVTVHFANAGSVDEHHILSPHPDEPPAVARVWIDLRAADHVTLYLAGMKEDRVLVRRVPLVDHIDEVAKEEIAHIVEATVDALLWGGRIGVATDEPRPPNAAPLPARVTGVRLDLGVGYEALAWSPTRPILHGPAFFVGMGARGGKLRPAFLLEGTLRFPTTIDGAPYYPVSTRLDQGALRALAVIDWAVHPSWSLAVGLGGGVDLVRVSPEATEGAQAEQDSMVVHPMVRGVAMVRYAFTSRSAIFAGVAADFDWLETRYLIRYVADRAPETESRELIFHPWRLRPLAFLGITSDVLSH